MKYTPQFLSKIEDIFAESDYILRYEKGNFKTGWCVLKDTRVVVVNKYLPLEGRINSVVDILRTLELNTGKMTEKSLKLLAELKKSDLPQSLPTGRDRLPKEGVASIPGPFPERGREKNSPSSGGGRGEAV